MIILATVRGASDHERAVVPSKYRRGPRVVGVMVGQEQVGNARTGPQRFHFFQNSGEARREPGVK